MTQVATHTTRFRIKILTFKISQSKILNYSSFRQLYNYEFFQNNLLKNRRLPAENSTRCRTLFKSSKGFFVSKRFNTTFFEQISLTERLTSRTKANYYDDPDSRKSAIDSNEWLRNELRNRENGKPSTSMLHVYKIQRETSGVYSCWRKISI